MDKIVITFDTETNGFKPEHSVLSISAMKFKVNAETKVMEKIGEYNRFYFCVEEENASATKIHGLTAFKIKQEREKQNAEYPIFYKDDKKSFEEFCKGTDLLVAHNYDFDSKFIEFKPKSFCTMKEGSALYKKENHDSKAWIKLKELASYFKIKVEEDDLHGSLYDTLILSRVLYKMLKYNDENFINKLK